MLGILKDMCREGPFLETDVIEVLVVDLDLPLLLSLPVLKKLDLVVQYRQQESTDLGYFNGVKFRIDNQKGHQWIRLSQTGSKTIFEVTLLGLDF